MERQGGGVCDFHEGGREQMLTAVLLQMIQAAPAIHLPMHCRAGGE